MAAKELLSAEQMNSALEQLTAEIHQEFPLPEGLAVIGIRTRGAWLAERIHGLLQAKYDTPIGLGFLDITFYRDDLSQLGSTPEVKESELPFDISGAKVVLVDDVVFTGRTIRAALDELTDYGRADIIRLACLVDRGHREIPIQPDYCALTISTEKEQHVRVLLTEVDDEDKVLLEEG